ncbi:MAG: hypothetical protein ACQESK_02115 [Bacteroidota bacterium]
MTQITQHIQLLVSIFLIITFSTTMLAQDEIKYFDEDGKEIRSSKVKKYLKKRQDYLVLAGNQANHKRIIKREHSGTIKNREELIQALEKQTQQKIDAEKLLVIVFYPGLDSCNSGGSATPKSRNKWYNELNERLMRIANTKTIHIYKNKEGLEKYGDYISWHKDPNQMIEQLFFKEHYPCASFVVIGENGDYISYFGEFTQNKVWSAAKSLR